MTLRVVGHELGHNFGVHHASTLACQQGGVGTTFTGSCTQSEYGDPFTVMGGAQTRHHVNWHRAQLGWFADTQTVTTSGTYALAPAELTGTPRMLRVARGDGTYLNLELRQPWGIFDNFSASDSVVNGVSIRIAPELTSLVQSKLVDANPGTATFSDAALGVGQSVTDPLTGVSITTLSVGPAGASVSVQFSAGTDATPPSTPTGLQATVQKGKRVALSWNASTDNVGVVGYDVFRNGVRISQPSGTSYTDRPGRGTFTYQVRARDAAGNLSGLSGGVTVTV
jgi:hypothetical protein